MFFEHQTPENDPGQIDPFKTVPGIFAPDGITIPKKLPAQVDPGQLAVDAAVIWECFLNNKWEIDVLDITQCGVCELRDVTAAMSYALQMITPDDWDAFADACKAYFGGDIGDCWDWDICPALMQETLVCWITHIERRNSRLPDHYWVAHIWANLLTLIVQGGGAKQ